MWTDIENLAPPPFLYRSITFRLKGMQNEYKQRGCVFVVILLFVVVMFLCGCFASLCSFGAV